MTIHNFDDSLQVSHNASDEPVWEAIYRKAFPDFSAMVDHRKNGDWQKLGIDRSVIFHSSKRILIDEKVRRKDYGDILLEYMSIKESNIPGWVCKPLLADYIAYCIIPTRVVYLLPVTQLQAAWQNYGETWKASYGKCKTSSERKGKRWTTQFCPVPVDVLFSAIGSMLRIKY